MCAILDIVKEKGENVMEKRPSVRKLQEKYIDIDYHMNKIYGKIK